MRQRLRLVVLVFTLSPAAGDASSLAQAHTLAGETFAGAFVTMTAGAKCPSATTIAFVAQGEANGPVPGVANERGSFTLMFDELKNVVSIKALTSDFEVNEGRFKGQIFWEPADAKPLILSCDPLSLRIEGRVRYRTTQPFIEDGIATIQISGLRRAITNPYFGQSATTFSAK